MKPADDVEDVVLVEAVQQLEGVSPADEDCLVSSMHWNVMQNPSTN